MSDEEFEALVQELQLLSSTSPGLYRLRVVSFAALGYGFLIASVVFLVLLSIGVIWLMVSVQGGGLLIKLIAPLVILVFIVLRSLWVRVTPPVGTPVQAEQAPALYDLLDEVGALVHGPPLHRILITDVFNASIVQVPRLGVFGWQQNFLVIGLPLMQLMPVSEFRAVMAHEMGHLVGSHGSFTTWVYRQGQTWARLLRQLEAEQRFGTTFFTDFLKWYGPRFNAHTFVMMRAHEYDADTLAASVATPRVAADALVRLATVDARLDRDFWPAVGMQARTLPAPPGDLMARIAQQAQVPVAPEDASRSLAVALQSTTASTDTHPSLKARLESLGQEPQSPAPFETSAAADLLGASLKEFQAELDRKWRERIIEWWQKEHAEAVVDRKHLAELETAEATAPLDHDQLWQRARILHNEGRIDESTAILEQLVASAPELSHVQAAWGMTLLRRGDERGLAHIDRAVELGPLPEEACQFAFSWLRSNGRPDEAARYATVVREVNEKLAAARAERAAFTITDPIEPHQLPEEQLAMIRQALAGYPDVIYAILVRRLLHHFPETPQYVLAIRVRTSWKDTLLGNRDKHLRQVLQAVGTGIEFKGDSCCLLLDKYTREQRKAFEKTAGAPFYRTVQ